MKAEGMNTDDSTSAIAISAAPTSSMLLTAASCGLNPRLDVTLDVFHDDDGVVDDNADGKHQTEQRQDC